MAVEKLSLKIHIFFALLGLFAGVLGFMVFVFGFYNYHAGEFCKKFLCFIKILQLSLHYAPETFNMWS